tara:strand:- start:903 stop:1112 length:210 start_codon:yes stop_codon:yes gene_type:complete
MDNKIKVNPAFENILEEISKSFKTTRSVARGNKTCVICAGPADKFKNALSAKEYTISGMCQTCQDRMFG